MTGLAIPQSERLCCNTRAAREIEDSRRLRVVEASVAARRQATWPELARELPPKAWALIQGRETCVECV